jgi:ADP-ribosylation factor-like protein 6
MGLFRRILTKLGLSKRKAKILVVGLDNAGKSSILNQLVKHREVEVAPTVGFQVTEFSRHNVVFTSVDMSGHSKYRNLWENYYGECSAIVFVIDATDRIRMCVAKDELAALRAHPDLAGRAVPLLFFANKMDVQGAADPLEVAKALDLQDITDKAWHITASNAMSGMGLDEGFGWLADRIANANAQG